jgi:enoyl-CoA hydratase
VSDIVRTAVDGGVALVMIDDGKMNALSPAVIGDLNAALDLAVENATAVCVVGNARALSAGFDLSVMTGDAEGRHALLVAGAELLMRLYVHPQPTVVAVTGHALAAGALLTLACDTRIAAPGSAKIGLNEVAIGLALPMFGYELALARLSERYLTRAAIQAEIFDPEGALAAGFVDRIDSSCVEAAIGEARRLGALSRGAYARTKRSVRQPMVDRVLASLDADLEGRAIET